jgi:hypothetical protein
MIGPIGSIEKTVGARLTSVSGVVHTLEADMNSLVGADDEAIYRNPEGTGQSTNDELAKSISVLLLVSRFSA